MDFSTHKDINAPIGYVYEKVTNFESYERQALRRGAVVSRVDGNGQVRVGSAWDVAFTFRGKNRKLRATIAEMTSPESMKIDTVATGLNSIADVHLIALSPKVTRVAVVIELSPKSLSARLLLQSLKLAKANLNKRFAKRVDEQVAKIAEDYSRNR
jgi:hypothetical protein